MEGLHGKYQGIPWLYKVRTYADEEPKKINLREILRIDHSVENTSEKSETI